MDSALDVDGGATIMNTTMKGVAQSAVPRTRVVYPTYEG